VPLARVAQDASADLKHSWKLYIYFSVIAICRSQKNPKANPTPRPMTGAAFLTAGHKASMTGILQSSISV